VSLAEVLAGTRAWVVGGTVRDELLGRPLKDVDLALAGDPEPVARRLAATLRGPVFALSEAFGAWRVIDRRSGIAYDLSPLQGETIEADLARRDFSVNALARPVTEVPTSEPLDRARGLIGPGGDLVDPTGGLDDLERRVLRVLGADAYASDPLRALRLPRFAAELGFAPDAETERLTRAAAPRVTEAAPERIFAELKRLLIAPGVLEGIALADRLGLLRAVLPELADLHGVGQSRYHHLDVYDHTLEVLARLIELEQDLERYFGELAPRLRAELEQPLADELTRGQALRLGALLHDIGKPATRGVRLDGRVTFIGHDAHGEEMVRTLCRRLRASEKLARFVEALTRQHLVLGFLVHERPLSRGAIYRYLKRTTPVEVEVTLLSCADRLATRGRKSDAAIAAHLELARELMADALAWRTAGPPQPLVRGDELARALGIAAGPALGRLLAQLEEAAFTGEVTSRDEAVQLARRLRHDSET
jgi:putative nucleotidyltransferase with HDIG domain